MPKAIARVLGLTERAIRLAPLRADAADILHPLLFIFDTAKQVGQRYFPPRIRPVVGGGRGRVPGSLPPERCDGPIRDTGSALRASRGVDPRPRWAGRLPVPQSREPLPDGTLHALEGSARSVLPRDDRDVPVPAARRHRVGNARTAGPHGARALSGMWAMD